MQLHHQTTTSSSSLKPARGLLVVLPTELVDHIIRHVFIGIGIREGRVLRLVCRVFNTLASRYGLPDVIAYLHPSDFNAIRRLASQPHVAMGVRTFTYVPDMVLLPLSLDQFNADYHEMRRVDIEEAPTAAARRKLRKKRILTNSEIHTHWQRSKAIASMQLALIDDEDDIEFLEDILPRLLNLRELRMQSELNTMMMSADDDDDETTAVRRYRKTPFSSGLTEFTWRPLQPEGVRALNGLLEALPQENKVTTIRAGAINWRFFDPTNRVPLSRLFDMAPRLARIGFKIETGWDEESEMFGTEAGMCRQTMKQGVLRELLHRTTNLELLYVDFEAISDNDGYPAHLHEIIGPNQHWPKLKSVELGGFECERHDLERFLRNHAGTLEEVFLRNISLQRTSWAAFLPEMHAICPMLHNAAITGPLYGENETTQEAEFWEVSDSTRSRDQLADAITGYLTCRDHDWHENPFVSFPMGSWEA